jgi:flavodoxin
MDPEPVRGGLEMKALVVYESLYGNTAAIGEAIASSLREHGLEVDSRPVSKIDATETRDAELLVVGGPTHAHGMSRNATRNTAVNDKKNEFPDPTVAPGLREWLKQLPSGAGRLAAAFDTRFDKPAFFTGSAAKGIAKRLEGRGFRLLGRPESFFVTTENRLADGQTEHASAWGAKLAGRASAGTRP